MPFHTRHTVMSARCHFQSFPKQRCGYFPLFHQHKARSFLKRTHASKSLLPLVSAPLFLVENFAAVVTVTLGHQFCCLHTCSDSFSLWYVSVTNRLNFTHHTNGRVFRVRLNLNLWVLLCAIKCELLLNPFPHSSHSYGFSPEWILLCLFKVLL